MEITYETQIDNLKDLMPLIDEYLRIFKSNNQYMYKETGEKHWLNNRPLIGKRFVLNGEEIGTLPKLMRKLDWDFQWGYEVVEVFPNAGHQIRIKTRLTDPKKFDEMSRREKEQTDRILERLGR